LNLLENNACVEKENGLEICKLQKRYNHEQLCYKKDTTISITELILAEDYSEPNKVLGQPNFYSYI